MATKPTSADSQTVQFIHDGTTYERASEAVVFAVAAASNTDAAGLTPLFESVDPDALDRLFRPGPGPTAHRSCCARFTYAGCEVELASVGPEAVAITVDSSA